MSKVLHAIRREWPIVLIIFIAFLLRIWKLTSQSLWLDELHNMVEADPSLPWSQLFSYLKCCDQHPPLYFIIERLAFTIFGHTEGVARSISVIAGTASVWAMWLLGKEIYKKELGYIAAILTCINYYNIFYSQEARGYIFAFLFAALSFLYFIRLIREPSRKNIVLYALYTLLLLYSHYYSLFVVLAQGLLALVFIFLEEKKQERIKLFKGFLFGGIIVAIGYAPWVPFLLEMSNIKSFWIGTVSHDFMITFFRNYFGDADTLIPILALLLVVYVIHVSVKSQDITSRAIRNSPLHFSFIIIICWVAVTYILPYLRSVLVVPMIYPRYTIVVLPAILLALAWGIVCFRISIIKYGILALVVVLSLIDIVAVKKYYTAVHKTQFREMTAFIIAENKGNYPIINETTSWHQAYYLKKMGSKAELLANRKEGLDGFWLAGAHGVPPLSDEAIKALEQNYVLLRQNKFYDAWAMLFVAKNKVPQKVNATVISYTDFAPGEGTVLNDEKVIAIWSGAIHTKTIPLSKGTYSLSVLSRGTSAKDEFSHLNVYCSGKKIGEFYTTEALGSREFLFENNGDNATFTIEMDNDFTQEGHGDRNAFIQSLILEKK